MKSMKELVVDSSIQTLKLTVSEEEQLNRLESMKIADQYRYRSQFASNCNIDEDGFEEPRTDDDMTASMQINFNRKSR